MIFLSRIYKITAFFIWSLIVMSSSIPYRFMGWEGRRKIAHLVQLWARGVAKIINLHVKTYGDAGDISSGLVVSNHLGYIDIITHGTIFPLRFTPKKEVVSWPLVGGIVSSSNPVIIDRTSKAASKNTLRNFIKTMRQGMYLIVYPEGTSTDGKRGIAPFKSTPFEAAILGKLPILPVLTRYRGPSGNDISWYGDMKFFPHLWKILALNSIEAEVRFLPAIFPEGKTRKEMSTYVHNMMDREYRALEV